MRGAAQGWEIEFGSKLGSVGFTRGKSTPVVFYRESDGTRLVVHGDDFTFLGYPEALDRILKDMREWWEVKLRAIIGDEEGDDKEVTILNRRQKWTGDSLELSADPKHVREILKEFSLTGESRGITVPIDSESITKEEDEELLEGKDVTRFR